MKKRTLLLIVISVVVVVAVVAIISVWSFMQQIERIRIGSIALIKLSGTISYSGAGLGIISGGAITPSDVKYYIDRALSDPSIRAVVFMINSPGGSAAASEDIYQLIKRLAESKVVVIYGAEVLASGGYYISLPAHRIVVSPHTLVGSIGSVTTLVDVSELLSKLGINVTVIKSGEYKDVSSPYRHPTEKELEILRDLNNKVAQIFKERVKEHRSIKDAEAFEAKIYLGIDAVEAGLVDEVGTLDRAIEIARQLAGLPPYAPVVEIKKPAGLLQMLFGGSELEIKSLDLKIKIGSCSIADLGEFVGKPLYLWIPGIR